MARGIQIPFTLDVRQWRKGIKRVELDIDDLGDEFRDLERDADRAANDITDSFRDIGRAAQRAGRDVDDGLTEGIADSGAAAAGGVLAGEVFDEFIQSWSQAINSGDYTQAIRDTFANLGQIGGAAFGPVGAAGGALAGALVLGFVDRLTAASEERKRITQAITTAVSGASDEAIQEQGYTSGQRFIDGLNQALSETATRQANLQERYGVDNLVDALKKAQIEADNLGVSSQIVQDIYAGTTEQAQSAVEVLNAQQDELQVLINQTLERAANEEIGASEALKTVSQYENQQDQLQGLIDAGSTRIGQAEEASAAVQREYEALGRVVDAIQDAISNQDALNDRLSTATGTAASIASNLSVASASARATRDYVASLGDKTVNVAVVARLVNQAELEAQIGGSLAGIQTELAN